DRIERDIAEIEQAGEADHHVQSPSEHHVSEHEDAEVENVALVVEDDRHQKGEHQQHRRNQTSGERKATLYRRRNHPDGADRPPPLPQQLDDDTAAEYG